MSNEAKNSTMSLKKKLYGDEENTSIAEQEGEIDAELATQLLEHPSYIELQNKLTQAEEESRKYLDKSLRLQADIENTLRRSERDVANAHKFALEKFASELLPVVDNLERAVMTPGETSESVLEGVALTLKLFISVLEKFGVSQVNPENQPFDPEFHQAISTQADKKVAPGTVLVVMQKGYLLNGRLIRPALVVVSKES